MADLAPGDPLPPASWWSARVADARRLLAFDVAPPLEWARVGGRRLLRLGGARPMEVELTAGLGSGAYAYAEKVRVAAGGWADVVGGQTGTIYEYNAIDGLAGEIVDARPDGQGDMRFKYHRSGTCPRPLVVTVRHLLDASPYSGASVVVKNGATTVASGATDSAGNFVWAGPFLASTTYGITVTVTTPRGTCSGSAAFATGLACSGHVTFDACWGRACVALEDAAGAGALSGMTVGLEPSCSPTSYVPTGGAQHSIFVAQGELAPGSYCFDYCYVTQAGIACKPLYMIATAHDPSVPLGTARAYLDNCEILPFPCGDTTVGLTMFNVDPDYVDMTPFVQGGQTCANDQLCSGPGGGGPNYRGLVKKRLRLDVACPYGSGIGLPGLDLDYVGLVGGIPTWASACLDAVPTGVGYACAGDPYGTVRPYQSVQATFTPCVVDGSGFGNVARVSYASYPAPGCSDLTDCVPPTHTSLGFNFEGSSVNSPVLASLPGTSGCAAIVSERP